jgi:hypothetical protein
LHTIFCRALKKPPNELCPALVSLCLFAPFFSPLHSSARNHATRFSMFFSSSKSYAHIFAFASAEIEPTTSPAGHVVLTTGITSSRRGSRLCFVFIADAKSKRGNFLKPCGRTTQFSAGLHCQSESSAGQSSLGRCVASRQSLTLFISTCNKCFNHGTWFLQKY